MRVRVMKEEGEGGGVKKFDMGGVELEVGGVWGGGGGDGGV